MEKLLPIGSIVYLQEGTAPMAIIAVAQLVQLPDTEEQPTYFDYCGSIYPEGMAEENMFYFNHSNISEVIFTGYESDAHNRYLKAVAEWKVQNTDSFVVGKVE